ncbi:WXG100 family type VII secretion target [Cryobacterium sp. CG_9.6]|uniref:WXG100 family type VII secretion target n=1 Tax=Cryobacterium sp. CG_9.6 TaxID=2760710 RepID=UPI002476749B|nr:WXG100 family type VII secretion target [Cryobacterium sp. CG_9.6]MDH6237836.1 WXG100 family type VII secretion target [Cryobacterium sp. CG_9.6]
MTSYQVDSDALITLASATRGTISRIEADVVGLHGQLVGVEAVWSGSASSAFQVAVAHWKAVQLQVEQSLADITAALGMAGQQYGEIEQANMALFTR